jgi:hypothetical protein
LLVYIIMTYQLSPSDFNANGGQPQQLAGSAYPNAFSSNLVGGYKHRRTYKRFMHGKKSYKKGVRKHIKSSSGLFSRMMRKMKGSRRK